MKIHAISLLALAGAMAAAVPAAAQQAHAAAASARTAEQFVAGAESVYCQRQNEAAQAV